MEFKRWSPVLECIIKCKFYVEGPIYNFEIARRKTTLLAQSKFFAFDDHKCCKFMQTLHYTWILTKSSFIWSKKRLILSPKHVFSNRTKWSTDVEEVFGQDSLIKRLHLYMFTSSLMSLEASFYVCSLTCEKYFSRLTSKLFASSNFYLVFLHCFIPRQNLPCILFSPSSLGPRPLSAFDPSPEEVLWLSASTFILSRYFWTYN